MRYWEFLIQQEGDQTWLPLETRQVEILEGRYRMAAHTSYDSTSVEIRVSQLLLDEIPPRRRVRKRKANTNDSGLLAIFPFIQLSPGRWEIDCNSPDVIEEFLGEGGWHYSVQLEVTPRDEDDWEPDWSNTAADYEHTPPDGANPSVVDGAPGTTFDGTIDSLAKFRLQLKQQAYVTQLGQSLTLAGQLSQIAGTPLVNGQLWVELRNPQTASVVQEKVFDIPNHPLPSPFSVTIPLPEELPTQVILGAISLVGRDHPSNKTALASASFTVTLGLAQMLDAIANQPNLEFEEEISIFPGSTEAFVPPPARAEALLANETPILPKEIVPSEGLTLPPQLKPPSELAPERQPELPTFPNAAEDIQTAGDNAQNAETTPETLSAPADPPDKSALEPSDIDEFEDEFEFEHPERSQTDSSAPVETPLADEQLLDPAFAEPKVFELGSIEDDDLDLELATAALDESPPPESLPLSKPSSETAFPHENDQENQWRQTTVTIDQAFDKLQLRERFWQKLSLLTQDGYRQSLEVKRALHPSEPVTEGNQQSDEFVAYEPPRRSRWSDHSKKQAAADPVQVMAPSLDVPQQELVAGEWIAIKVRVPAGEYQPYVKVWMNDLQTRTVIDAPRLLMQFVPNDNNELETLMRVQIPKGCLELQFAAISIDMSTLQESRKVIQNRRVMPPDDSLSVFDDWDI